MTRSLAPLAALAMLFVRPFPAAAQSAALAVAAGPMIASPAAGASWRFRLSGTFLFPR